MLRIIVISAATLMIALVARRTERSWAAPAAFFAVMWSGYLFSAVLFVVDADRILNGMLWIALNTGVFLLGTVLAHPYGQDGTLTDAGAAREHPRISGRGLAVLRYLCLAAIVAGAGVVFVLLIARGFSWRQVVSFAVLAQVTAQNRAESYAGIFEPSAGQRLVFVGLFLGTLYGGLLFRLSARRVDRLVAIGALVMISFLYTLYGSRMGVLYGGAFWLGAYLAAHVYIGGDDAGSTRFLVGMGFAAVVILLGMSTLTQVVRYSMERLDWYKMLADPFAFVAAFGIWFDSIGWHSADLFIGARTFRRIFELFGVVHERLPAIDVGFSSSNVYTVFADLLEDFGTLGSLAVMLLLGVFARRCYVAVIRRSATAIPWLVFAYGFILTSFAWGLLSYTTPVIAVVLFTATFRWLPPFIEPQASEALPVAR